MWTNEQIEILKNYYVLGGYDAVAQKLPYTLKQVQSKVRKLKLKINENKIHEVRSKNAKKQKPKSNIDETKFTTMNDLAIYIMGFIWADGYLINSKKNMNKIKIEITTKDFKQLEKIFTSVGHWTKTERLRKNRQPQTTIETSNVRLYNYLINKGYGCKKLDSPSFIFSEIPEEKLHLWFLGYFDGDGCFYNNKRNYCNQMSIAGTYDQNWEFVEILLQKLNIKNYKITQRVQQRKNKLPTRSSTLRISNLIDIIKFGKYIYQDKIIGLKRKNSKWLKMTKNYLSANSSSV